MERRNIWLGILLIAVGSLLLSNRVGLVHIGFWDVLWLAVAVSGAYLLWRGFSEASSRRGLVFWGTGLFLGGGLTFLQRVGVLSVPSYVHGPLLLMIAGIAVLVVVIRFPRGWHLAVPGIVLLGLGTVMLLADIDVLSPLDVRSAVRQYWPVALIAFGIALLLNRRTA